MLVAISSKVSCTCTLSSPSYAQNGLSHAAPGRSHRYTTYPLYKQYLASERTNINHTCALALAVIVVLCRTRRHALLEQGHELAGRAARAQAKEGAGGTSGVARCVFFSGKGRDLFGEDVRGGGESQSALCQV